MLNLRLRTLGPLSVWLLTCASCAESAIRNDDSLFDDSGLGSPSANVLPDGGRRDETALDGTVDGGVFDSALPAVSSEAGSLDASDGAAMSAHDGAALDSGAHDAALSDGGNDASSDAATSCVPDQCTAKCGIFKGCCSVLNVCACEDLFGLCVLPAT